MRCVHPEAMRVRKQGLTLGVILVTGASGFIGSRILAHLAARPSSAGGPPVVAAMARREVPGVRTVLADLRDEAAILHGLDDANPSIVIHAGAMRDPASCEQARDEATAVNFHATRAIARWCEAHAARLIFLSTDLVFDGVPTEHAARPSGRASASSTNVTTAPATPPDQSNQALPDGRAACDAGAWLAESAPRRPINHYGVTKALAEDVVCATPRATVARVGLTLGHSRPGEPARSPHEFVVHALRAGKPANLFENELRTPIYVEDAARAIVALIEHEVPCVHVGGPQRVSRMEMGVALARAHGLDERLCIPSRHDARASGIQRPLDTAMDTTLLMRLLAKAGAEPPRGMDAMAQELASSEPDRRPNR
jgi:dTDP-4-dehydrorhamnose reductase